MAQSGQGEMFPSPPAAEGLVVINQRCQFRTQDGHRVVMASGLILAQYAVGDRMSEAYAMVSLVGQGLAEQEAVALAFGCTPRTVRRYQARLAEGGLAALGRPSGYPKGRRRLSSSRLRLVSRLKAEGHPNTTIAQRLGVSEMAVRKLLRRAGWRDTAKGQARLPFDEAEGSGREEPAREGPDANLSATAVDRAGQAQTDAMSRAIGIAAAANPNLSAMTARLPASVAEAHTDPQEEEPLPFSLDTDPAERCQDRLFASLGLLDDAAPLFRAGLRVPGAGVLLALPALVESGVFRVAREIYGSIGPAFYGLRTTVLALLLMALLRMKRPESLKEHPPDDLGRVLGLDRAPEVKTMRRKLARLAAYRRAADFGRALARDRVVSRGAALGFLYLDGHVRAYHGKRNIPKAHVARMRISMPATTDYWVGDAGGEPLFVVTAEANEGLVEMLPRVLAEVRPLLGQRRITVVFDRGGWSPQLFAQILARGFDILTYRKAPFPRVVRRLFREYHRTKKGKKETYWLADHNVRLRLPRKKRLKLRQVTRLAEGGHQTPIVTSLADLPPLEVALRMFARWKQENFFKYLREQYAIDALVDYKVEAADPLREVPNPARKAIEVTLRKAQAALASLQAAYGEAALNNPERVRPSMRGFKITHGKLGRALREAMERVATLEARRAKIPTHVPVQNVAAGEVIKLAPERKLLTNLIKMVAYQAESDLVALLAPHYSRVDDEARTLIRTALQSAADIEVTGTDLRIQLVPLSSPHRTAAIAALCREVGAPPTVFPGTRLRLCFSVGSHPGTAAPPPETD